MGIIDKLKSLNDARLKRAEQRRAEKAKFEVEYKEYILECEELAPFAPKNPEASLYRHAWRRAEVFKQMLEGGWRNPDRPSHYGFGIFFDGKRNAIGHGGMWPGYRTDVMHFFDRGITVAVQANTDWGFDTEGLMDRIAALAD